jgi:hypothetical protein
MVRVDGESKRKLSAKKASGTLTRPGATQFTRMFFGA